MSRQVLTLDGLDTDGVHDWSTADLDDWSTDRHDWQLDLDAAATQGPSAPVAERASWRSRTTPLVILLAVLLVVNPASPRLLPDGRVLRGELQTTDLNLLDQIRLTATLANVSALPVRVRDVGLATRGLAADPLPGLAPTTLAAGGVLRIQVWVRPDCQIEQPSASLVVYARSVDGAATGSVLPLDVRPAGLSRLCPPRAAGRNVLATGWERRPDGSTAVRLVNAGRRSALLVRHPTRPAGTSRGGFSADLVNTTPTLPLLLTAGQSTVLRVWGVALTCRRPDPEPALQVDVRGRYGARPVGGFLDDAVGAAVEAGHARLCG